MKIRVKAFLRIFHAVFLRNFFVRIQHIRAVNHRRTSSADSRYGVHLNPRYCRRKSKIRGDKRGSRNFCVNFHLQPP